MEFEASVVAQCDALISFIQQRKLGLIEAITAEMNLKVQKLKEQMKTCEKKFQSVAGLLQYGNECLQETDAASFLLVRLINNQLHPKSANETKAVGEGLYLGRACTNTVKPPLVATSLQQPLFPADSPYIDSCLNLSTMAAFFCPQGGCCGEVQMYFSLD